LSGSNLVISPNFKKIALRLSFRKILNYSRIA